MARPTPRGWVIGLAGALAIALSYPLGRRELLYLGVLLVLLPLLAWLVVRFRPLRLSVQRSFDPPIVVVGDSSLGTLRLRNLGPSTTTPALWRETLPWDPYSTAPRELPPIPASGAPAHRDTVELLYEFTPQRRGVFEVGPFVLELTDPFGLASGAVNFGESQPLIVTPDIVPFSDEAVSIAADEGSTLVLQRRAIGGDDDLTTREYRRGDAMRRVHWRASAHHGELMVRQEEQRSHAEARVVLDTLRSDYDDRGEPTADLAESDSFEWAVAFATSLSLHLQRAGFVVQAVETGRAQLAQPEQPEEFLRSLAELELTDERAESFSLLGGVSRPDRSQGSVFVVLAEPDDQVIERMLAQRSSFELAVAYLLASEPEPLAEVLGAAGWTCVIVDPTDPVSMAWLALGQAQGTRHGR